MNVLYTSQQLTDSPADGFQAIKVYADGNPIVLGGPFATEEEAEECAARVEAADKATVEQRTAERALVLEQMVDTIGLPRVVEELAVVCLEKAEHVRTNWQDHAQAARWGRQAEKLAKLAPSLRMEW